MAVEIYRNADRAQVHIDVADLKQIIAVLKEIYTAPYFGHDLVALLAVLEVEWKRLQNNAIRVTFPMATELASTFAEVCSNNNMQTTSYAGDGVALALKTPKY